MASDEQKIFLNKQYRVAVQRAIASKQPHAIALVEDSHAWGTELTIQSFSLEKYVAEHGYEEAIVHAHEKMRHLGWAVWLIDCVGAEFTEEENAFENAWDNRLHFYGSRGMSVPA